MTPASPSLQPGASEEVTRVVTTRDSLVARGEIPGVFEVRGRDGDLRAVPLPLPRSGPRPFAPPPGTPPPQFVFDTDPLAGGPDATLAASTTHVCVTNRSAFGCYTKSGVPVSPGLGLPAGQILALTFFQATPNVIPGSVADCTTDFAKDARIVFDQVHRRFFLVFQSRELPARLLIAVSKSEDPSDGWFTYADDLSTLGTNGSDYQWAGINATHLLLSEQLATGCSFACYSGAKNTCNPTKTYHLSYTIADMLNGLPYTRGVWTSPDAQGAVPAVHDSSTNDAFYVHRDDGAHASVWAVRNGIVSRSAQVPITQGLSPVDGLQPYPPIPGFCTAQVPYAKVIGSGPQNVEFRDGHLNWVSNDGIDWSGASATSTAVHLARFDVGKYYASGVQAVGVQIDRIYGRASASDPPGSVFDYGIPAVSSNANGDLIVGEIRSSCTTYPEFRASAFLAGQTDVSESMSLFAQSDTPAPGHMAGASADPSGQGIYIGQIYARGSTWRIRVAKMLGTTTPDLIATQITAPPIVTRGVPFTAAVTLLNQGDATATATTSYLRLSPDDVISVALLGGTTDPKLASFITPVLGPGWSKTVNVQVTIPTTQPAGVAYLGAQMDVLQGIVELSEFNNLNPFLASPHGNTAITIH